MLITEIFERRLEDDLKTYLLRRIYWSNISRRLLKTYDQGEHIGLDQDVFKMFSRRPHQDECLLGC